MNDNPDKVILTVAEFLSDAQTNDLGAEDSGEEEKEMLARARARRDEEWSLLANQVVGGEKFTVSEPKAAD